MISENVVDLSGFAYNIKKIENEKFVNIVFTLNVRNQYKDVAGEYVTKYDRIPCKLSSKKQEDGSYSKKIEYFENNIEEGRLLRVQGKVNTWLEILHEHKWLPYNDENKDKGGTVVNKFIMQIKDFKFLETIQKGNENNNDSFSNDLSSHDENIEFPVYESYSQ